MLEPIINCIKPAIQEETKKIIETYGKGYHSDFEFYGVLKEEVEEATYEMNRISYNLEEIIWKKGIRTNDPVYTDNIKQYILNCIAELIQCYAVCNRREEGLKGE